MMVRRDIAREHVPREVCLVIRERLARKAGWVGSVIFASRACCARLACLVHHSRMTIHGKRSGFAIVAETLMNNVGYVLICLSSSPCLVARTDYSVASSLCG